MKITLHAGGSAEQKIELADVQIPDLWHIAHRPENYDVREVILSTWSLAHALLNKLREVDREMHGLNPQDWKEAHETS